MKKKIFTALVPAILCILTIFGLAACGGGGDTAKAVSKIEVDTNPSKVEYYVDETFSAEGGVILVTYEDGTTEKVPMTAEGVELTSPDMAKAGNKWITVTYGGKRVRFSISVANQGFKFTYDMGYEGGADKVIDVVKNAVIKTPEAPVRDGHTFYKWYSDEACTVPFDFTEKITSDTTVYGTWKENGVTYYEAVYSLNYYGKKPSEFVQLVKSGESVKNLVFTPTRDEYKFDGWYTDEAGTTPFANKVITADTVIYAKWTKTKTGVSTYTFEAEKTNLTGKIGPGFSGTAQEGSMVVANASASGGKAVSYLYRKNNSLEFYIACDEDVSGVKIVLSLGAEMDNINFSSDEFQVLVNGKALSYGNVSLANNNSFSDAITVDGVSLKKGENLIKLNVNNNKRPMGDASTYEATAPMVDCVKITTTAVLAWDQNFSLPMTY